ncbi:PEP-CTERM sorting domain-containing protein [Solimicrobium silvestre]|uniref:PEP-CTERM protein-sorting domain n=1 Tax=Solimicrobium silvestre TaxID=2099400 RepID=A0A2S9GZV5_9BURK|nr:PEP-CTERM sorting domain-containing protein [Solimicrobium silvestre]PRC93264.1 PEP-CTERM protein-sorting domain [Solimicrobium silvestre]
MNTRNQTFVKKALFAMMFVGASAQAVPFTYTGSIVDYTITTSGVYDLTAAGAQGGSGNGVGTTGGLGAQISGDLFLTTGTQLGIVVGGQGLTGNFGGLAGGGGGGGSFVYIIGSTSPLIVAGGGGGAGYIDATVGGGGQTTTSGQAGFGAGGGAGGSAGSGGAGGNDEIGDNGGGGGGWGGNGGDGVGTTYTQTGGAGLGGAGAFSFLAGFGDCDPSVPACANGGFGGGGGGGWQGGGGGGGYSGGGGGDGTTDGGGGGGSYIDASFLSIGSMIGGSDTSDNGAPLGNANNGFVNIDMVLLSNPVPEPLTLALMAIGLAGLGFIRRKKARI